jgi:hypothetical protein
MAATAAAANASNEKLQESVHTPPSTAPYQPYMSGHNARSRSVGGAHSYAQPALELQVGHAR